MVKLWNLFQLSRWLPAVKPWEWLDVPDWYEYALDFMRIDDRMKEQQRKKRGK